MKIFNVTLPIYHGMPVYEGDPQVSIARRLSIAQGAPANVSRLAMGSHTGTRLDAPRRFLDGAIGVDRLSLDVLIQDGDGALAWVLLREMMDDRDP